MNIEEARDYCLSKPFATEDMPFGEDCVVFRVAEKIFAGLSLSQGNVLQMKCDPADFDEILAQYPYICQAYHWLYRKSCLSVKLIISQPPGVEGFI